MRYWAYLAGKLALAGGISWVLMQGLSRLFPARYRFKSVDLPNFGTDLWYTAAMLVWFLATCGLLYLCVWDQRYRCRVCLRRLRMPIETGSWSSMLQLGRPRIEYICLYGHGRLNVSEVQISGAENPEWTPQGDMWAELAAASREPRDD
jgi:hypothetical protein